MPCMVKDLATLDYILCTQLQQMDREYCTGLQTNISSITGVQMLMYMHKLCVKCCLSEFFDCLDCEFLNQESSVEAKDFTIRKNLHLGTSRYSNI